MTTALRTGTTASVASGDAEAEPRVLAGAQHRLQAKSSQVKNVRRGLKEDKRKKCRKLTDRDATWWARAPTCISYFG